MSFMVAGTMAASAAACNPWKSRNSHQLPLGTDNHEPTLVIEKVNMLNSKRCFGSRLSANLPKKSGNKKI